MFSEHPHLPDSFDVSLRDLRSALSDSQRRELEAHANVVGVGLGPRRENGALVEDSPCAIVIFVDQKQPQTLLMQEAIVPEEIEVEGASIPTDVQQSGGEFAPTDGDGSPAQTRRERVRPVLGGLAASASGASNWGTITGRFYDDDGEAVILTARHIAGGGTSSPANRDVVQPAESHADNPDAIGRVNESSDWNVNSTIRAISDVATVRVDEDDVLGHYLGFGHATGTGTTSASQRLVCISAGQGLSSGDLIATDVTTSVSYGDDTVRYRGLESYERISGSGSSGSAVGHIDPVSHEFVITGIHFAGGSERSLMTPWRAVEEELGELTPDDGEFDIADADGGSA